MKKVFQYGWLIVSLLLVFCSNSFASEVQKKPKFVLKMHVNQPATDKSFLYIYAKYLAEGVARKTNGQMKIEIYPGSQLGTDTAVLEQITMGTIECGMISQPNLISIHRAMNAFSLPYLWEDFDSASRGMTGPTAESIYKDLEENNNLKILGVFNGGARVITNNVRPLNTLEDFKGLRIRTPPTPVLIRTAEALGINPVSLTGAEVYTALQQGIIDGQESDITWGYGQGYSEVQKYLAMTEHAFTGNCFIINKNFFYNLPQNFQTALKSSAEAAAVYCEGFTKMFSMTTELLYEIDGVEITRPNKDVLRKKAMAVWEQFEKRIGGREVIDGLINDGILRVR